MVATTVNPTHQDDLLAILLHAKLATHLRPLQIP